MCKIYLATFDNILRAFDFDTCYIIYRDAGYIIIRLHIEKSTKKKSLNKNTFLKYRLRNVPSKDKYVMIAQGFFFSPLYFLFLYFLCKYSFVASHHDKWIAEPDEVYVN